MPDAVLCQVSKKYISARHRGTFPVLDTSHGTQQRAGPSQTCEPNIFWIIMPCDRPPFSLAWPFSSSIPFSRPSRCSPPPSRSSSSLPASVSTRRHIRPPTSLPMPHLRQNKVRQGPTSVGLPQTRPRCARMPTVSARRAKKSAKNDRDDSPPLFLISKLP